MSNSLRIVVDPKKCTASGECVRICPVNAFSIADGLAVCDHSKCDLDGLCIAACPNHAIAMEEVEDE